MTHTETIWIVVTITFASTFGVYAIVRKIQQIWPNPPVNVLRRRRGDIELTDYIEPTRPQQIHNYPDLNDPGFPIYDRVSDSVRVNSYWSGTPPSYQSGIPPSYQSGTIPSYHTIDRWYINSWLESEINLKLILWLILFLILGLILKKLSFRFFKKNENIVFTKGISTNEITFTSDYQELLRCRLGDGLSYDIIYKNTYYHILNPYFTLFDIIDFLKSLDEADYAVTFELISKTSDGLFLNYPRIILSKEFMLNKCSDPVLISRLLSTELENIYRMFDAEDNEKHYIRIQYTYLTASQ